MRQESQQIPPAAAECPPLEELACLVDGILSPESAEATLGHVLACPRCYEVYVGLLRFQLVRPSEVSGQAEGKVLGLPPPAPPVSFSSSLGWGRWRPAAAARQVGPAAVLLERLVYRDGLPFDEACEVLRTRHGVQVSREELETCRRALPIRAARPRDVGLYLDADSDPSPEPSP